MYSLVQQFKIKRIAHCLKEPPSGVVWVKSCSKKDTILEEFSYLVQPSQHASFFGSKFRQLGCFFGEVRVDCKSRMRTAGLVIAVGILVAVLLVVSNGGGVDGVIRAPRSKLSMMTGLKQTGRAGHRFSPYPSQGLQQDHPAQEEDHSQWTVERMSLSPP